MVDKSPSDKSLFSEFDVSTYEEWKEATIQSLKGKPFEKLIKRSYEGFDVHPMYCADDIKNTSHIDTLPGHFPYVRGTKIDGYQSQPWRIAQEINISDVNEFNQTLKKNLEHGQTAIYIGKYNQLFHNNDKLSQAFDDINLSKFPLFVSTDCDAIEVISLIMAHIEPDSIHGCIGYDPLHHLATEGTLHPQIFNLMADLTQWAEEYAPKLDTIAIHTSAYHNAGANAVQELAIAITTGVYYINQLLERGLDIDSIAQKMRFFLNIGENFFMEIAKLRAIKILWAQIIREFGGDEESAKIRLHASTGLRNKTRYDPHVNMLRVTTEAMAGALGGIDSLSVSPFDSPYGDPYEFSERIARNVQLILQEEVNLLKLVDPAGGSWYIESLTEQLAQSAWSLFQQIEAQEGMLSALQNDFIHNEIQKVADNRQDKLNHRKDILVGTNMYANLGENLPDYRVDTTSFLNLPQHHLRRPEIKGSLGIAKVNASIDAVKAGLSKFDLTYNLLPDESLLLKTKPLPVHLVAQRFEELRDNAEIYHKQNGHYPQIFLANLGQLSNYKARMDFTRGFFEVGGFEVIDKGGYESIEEAIEATLTSQAKAIVICSTDNKYSNYVPQFAQTLKSQNPNIIIILAGYPKDKIEAYQKAGVDDFIYLGANCYEKNKTLQERLGVGS